MSDLFPGLHLKCHTVRVCLRCRGEEGLRPGPGVPVEDRTPPPVPPRSYRSKFTRGTADPTEEGYLGPGREGLTEGRTRTNRVGGVGRVECNPDPRVRSETERCYEKGSPCGLPTRPESILFFLSRKTVLLVVPVSGLHPFSNHSTSLTFRHTDPTSTSVSV